MVANALTMNDSYLDQQMQLVVANKASANARVVALLASLIGNDSTVPGVTVKDALENLAIAGSAYDHVVRSINDLPAPVAGVRSLTSGSWAFTVPIDLGSDILLAPAGTSVLLKGMGPTKKLTGSGAAVLRIAGTAYLESMSVGAKNGGGIGLHINSGALDTVYSVNGRYNNEAGTSSESVRQDAGFFFDVGSLYGTFNGGTDGFGLYTANSEAHILQGNFVGSNAGGNHHAVNSSGAYQLTLTDCILSSPNHTIEWVSDSLHLTNSVLFCGTAAGDIIRLGSGTDVDVQGGQWIGGSGANRCDGMSIEGNVTSISVEGVYAENIAADLAMVEYNSGTVGSCQVINCRAASSVGHGVIWPAASIPTLGLLLCGNVFNTSGAAISGFTPATARVNSKCNADSGGLMTETAIVP